MPYRYFFLLVIAFIAGPASFAAAQVEKVISEQPKRLLQRGAMFYGYPGTMAFHTAFHVGVTTRYLLLKSSDRLPELREYLALDATQINLIAKLQMLDIETVWAITPKVLADPNAEPDEQIVNPDYFSFLSSEQFSKLDRVALEFDGFSSLSRRSVMKRLGLSQETSDTISATLLKNRNEIFLPYFRWRFAAPLPPDHEFQDCEFSGKYIVHLNREIIDVLSPKEAQSFVSWFSVDPPSSELIKGIKRLAPMPTGLFGLLEHNVNDQNNSRETPAPSGLNPQ